MRGFRQRLQRNMAEVKKRPMARIRQGKARDIDELLAIEDECFSVYYYGQYKFGPGEFRYYLRSPGGIFWFPKGARWTTRDKAMFAILYRSADWVPSDPRTRRTITIIRALHVLAILGWSVALAGLIMSEGK